jgi:alpha-glucoside transport system permease protein
MSRQVLLSVAVTVGAPVVLLSWLWLVERLLRPLSYRGRRRTRPWLWLAPPLAVVGLYLVWPLMSTIWTSFQVRGGQRGLDNYRYLVHSGEVHDALVNNGLWLVGLTAGSLVAGTAVAVLAHLVRWETAAKAVVVMPAAISTVAAAVIWRFMFDYRPPGVAQTGTLNAVVTAAGAEPVAWLVDERTNNAALIGVGIWMSVGLVTVVMSASIKALPAELIDAGRVDGAGPFRLFRYVVLPQLLPTIVVVSTLLAITALKAFDVVYVMTNGNYDTNVLANLMYRELFLNADYGRSAALAVLLVILVLPVVAVNLRFFRKGRA